MIKTIKISTLPLLIAASLATHTTQANEQDGDIYVGMHYTQISAKSQDEGLSLDVSMPVLNTKVGYQISPYFSAELRLGFGIGDDTQAVMGIPGVQTTAEIDSMSGLFLRASYPVTDQFKPYAMLGYSNIESTGKISAPEIAVFEEHSGSDSDIAFGLGLDYDIGNFTLNAEFARYFSDGGDSIDGFGIGLHYRL